MTALTPAALDVTELAALIALFAEVAAYEDGAMRRAIEQAAREMAGAA